VIVNIPRVKSEFGKEMRAMFVAPPGKILAGYDAKQLELRMLAHYIGDQEYVERVTTTDQSRDAHVLAAAAAGSGDRDFGKSINYALIYGAGDERLGSLAGAGKDRGAEIRAELYRVIPGLERIIRGAKAASQRGHLIGLDGRKFYIRSQRISPLNTLIQGGGSIFMKRVSVILDRLARDYAGWAKVVDMHDEAQWEIPDTEESKGLFKSCVLEAFKRANEHYNLRCPQEPDVKYGKDWSCTH
jgi:DNA polymerase I-like protein with 3'-5' exonuclease and polymerase domains